MQSSLSNAFSGRLVGLILRELGRHEPAVFCAFLKRAWVGIPVPLLNAIKGGKAQIEREYLFKSNKSAMSNQSADVAVLVDGEAVLLIEIKEDDVDAPGNLAQHRGYLRWISTESRSSDRTFPALLLHLSRYHARRSLPIRPSHANNARVAYYADLYSVVSEWARKGGFPLSQMIVEYMEDIGVAAYRSIDLKAQGRDLTYLGVQMLGFESFNGFGRLASGARVAASPILLSTLLGNAEVFGDWLHHCNRNIFSQRPLARFRTQVRCPEVDLQKAIKRHKELDEPVEIPDRAISEGSLYVCSGAKFGGPMATSPSPGWMYVGLGFSIWLEKGNDQGAQISLYAEIQANDFYEYEETGAFKVFPSELEALKMLAKCLRDVRTAALKSAGGTHLKALKTLKIPDVAKAKTN